MQIPCAISAPVLGHWQTVVEQRCVGREMGEGEMGRRRGRRKGRTAVKRTDMWLATSTVSYTGSFCRVLCENQPGNNASSFGVVLVAAIHSVTMQRANYITSIVYTCVLGIGSTLHTHHICSMIHTSHMFHDTHTTYVP